MNHILRSAEQIPLQERIHIIDNLFPEALAGNHGALSELFHLYNQYINGEGEKKHLGCDMCRTLVISRFKTIISHWQGNP